MFRLPFILLGTHVLNGPHVWTYSVIYNYSIAMHVYFVLWYLYILKHYKYVKKKLNVNISNIFIILFCFREEKCNNTSGREGLIYSNI